MVVPAWMFSSLFGECSGILYSSCTGNVMGLGFDELAGSIIALTEKEKPSKARFRGPG